MNLRVAAAQFRSVDDPRENALAVERWAARAADQGADLLVCPEATMVNFRTRLGPHAEPLDGPFAESVRASARHHGLWLVVGMFEPADHGRVHNTLLATDGEAVHSYRKLHLYDALGSRESRTVAPGEHLVTFEALETTVGLATCYDVRFAGQFADLRRAGAEIICLPASWAGGPGKREQWDLLVRARAMDAQAFVVGADQSGAPDHGGDDPLGADGGRALGVGHSLVAGPSGTVAASLGAEDGLLVSDIDLTEVARVREAIPLG